jgi:hypothetical protein
LRGCLSVLVIAAAFLVGIVWFGGPPLAATVVEASLTGSGFNADAVDVTVEADPPLALAVGRADHVQIDASGVRWKDLHARSMSMRLEGVDLLGRTAKSANGRFTDVEIPVPGAAPALVEITIAGPANRARTTILVDRASINRLALAAFELKFGTRPDSVELTAPDRIQVRLGGNSLNGTLRVDASGALVVASTLGTASLIQPGQSFPLTINAVSVGDGALELTGTVDLQSLLR